MKVETVNIAEATAAASTAEPESRESRVYDVAETPQVTTSRISIPLTESGAIDFEHMRGGSKAKIIAALQHPETQSRVAPASPEVSFSEDDCKALLNGLVQIEQLAAKLLLKIPSDVAAETIKYTDMDIAMLTPPLQGVLGKYAPGWLTANKDVIALSLIFAGITRRQFSDAVALAKERHDKDKASKQSAVGAAA